MTSRQLSHYLVGEQIGEGGMGIVYKGTDTLLGRTVALKFLTKSLPIDAAERERLLREARAASSVNHPNVCVIHDVVEVEGEQFIVMEFVEGITLREWVNEKKAEINSRFLPVRDIIPLALQVAEGLNAAHKKGIVHRDVKPENVMISTDGRAKIMDFGLAKIAGESKLTRSGAAVGTVAYMSPEQVQAGEIDARSDIYSFGVVLYELLAGMTPFQSDHSVGMMYAIVHTEPRALLKTRLGINPELAQIVMKCLKKEKGDRYSTMMEVIKELLASEKLDGTISAPVIERGRKSSISLRGRVSAEYLRKHVAWVIVSAIAGLVIIVVVSRIGSANGALLSVNSVPEGSQVSINGRVVGLTPVSYLRVPAGQSTVHIVLNSYMSADTSITLEHDQTAELRFSLRPVEPKKEIAGSLPIARGDDSTEIVGSPQLVSRPSEGPPQAISVDDLATELVVLLQKNAGSLKGYVTVRPFTFKNTQIGSEFSKFFESLLESRIGRLTHWEIVSINDVAAGSARSNGPHAEYEVTGDYWEEGGQLHFFARLKDRHTGGYTAQADALVSSVEMKKKKIPWKPGNIKQVLEETKELGKLEPENGDLKLELLTNKGAENLLFTEGDTLRTFVRVNRPCTVRVFYYGTDGTRYLLTGPDDRTIDASQVNELVQVDSASISAPFGADIVQAFATTAKFEGVRTKQVDNGYYVVENTIESAMISTRGIKKIEGHSAVVEKRVVVTTVSK